MLWCIKESIDFLETHTILDLKSWVDKNTFLKPILRLKIPDYCVVRLNKKYFPKNPCHFKINHQLYLLEESWSASITEQKFSFFAFVMKIYPNWIRIWTVSQIFCRSYYFNYVALFIRWACNATKEQSLVFIVEKLGEISIY